VKNNGEARLKQPQEVRITVDKQESTPEKQESTIKKMIGEEEDAAEKNGYKTVMDRNNLSLVERRRVIPY
jgi:hypothetical protein